MSPMCRKREYLSKTILDVHTSSCTGRTGSRGNKCDTFFQYSNIATVYCAYLYTDIVTHVLKPVIISVKNVGVRAQSRVVPPTETVDRKVGLHPHHGQINIMPVGQVSGLCCDFASMSVFHLHGQ